jgi:hypothetical protein
LLGMKAIGASGVAKRAALKRMHKGRARSWRPKANCLTPVDV